MAPIDVAGRLGAGLASLAEAVVFVIVFEAALEARRKVLGWSRARRHPPIRFTATAPRTNVATQRPPRAPRAFGSAGLSVADVNEFAGAVEPATRKILRGTAGRRRRLPVLSHASTAAAASSSSRALSPPTMMRRGRWTAQIVAARERAVRPEAVIDSLQQMTTQRNAHALRAIGPSLRRVLRSNESDACFGGSPLRWVNGSFGAGNPSR